MEISTDKSRPGYNLVENKLRTLADYFPEFYTPSPAQESRNDKEDSKEGGYDIVFSILKESVSYYCTALLLVNNGKPLSTLIWQDFENFVAEWLLFKGLTVKKSCGQNTGINIESYKIREGKESKYIWITKKYSLKRSIGVRIFRELDYLILKSGASRGVIITTSSLTKGAKKMIAENRYRMHYIDNEMLLKDFV